MIKSIYIHIGTHKTGTSSIQKTLIENQGILKKEGAKYINLYNFEQAQAIMELEEEDSDISLKLQNFLNSQVSEIYNKYIICCEYLSGNPKKLYQNSLTIAKVLHKSLSDFDEKKIFVALREQEQFIQSIYTQYVHQGEDFSIDTFLDETKLKNIKWTQFVQNYQSVFGSHNLICVPYDQKVLERRNVLNLFGEFCDILFLKDLNLKTLNHGYSKEAMEIAKACNPELNKEEQKILRYVLQENFGKQVFSRYDLLDKNKIEDLNAFFKVDNEKLFQDYMSGFGLTNFSNPKNHIESSLSRKKTYTKLVVLLIKKVNNLSQVKNISREYFELNFTTLASMAKRVLKSKLKRIFKKNTNNIYGDNIVLKQKFEHYKQAVVLGSSSSINKLDVTQFSNDFVITVGNFYEHPEIEKINPKIHVFAASHPPITKEVLTQWWTRCNSVLPKGVPLLIEKRDKEIAQQVFKDRELFFYSYGGQVPVDFTKPILSPWSVTVVALQLAIYCKIKTIGILGVNHDWQCLKPYTHFYDHTKPSLEYYLHQAGIEIGYEKQRNPLPKERLYKEYELYQQYEILKDESVKLGIEIYNYDPYSGFDVFEKDNKIKK
ncbi:MAG: hypothetical protein KDD26_08230 [Winogradskyella sp.]|nr:hypothetical protein [Winogradskyella sp.]